MTTPRATQVRRALAQRAQEVARFLELPEGSVGSDDLPYDDSTIASKTLLALVAWLADRGSTAEAWLVAAGVSGAFPTMSAVIELGRRVTLDPPAEVANWVMDTIVAPHLDSADAASELSIRRGIVAVDVDFTARTVHNTGIQRVIRRTMPFWSAHEDVVFVAGASTGAFRELSSRERRNLLQWGDVLAESESRGTPAANELTATRLIIPWDSTVVLTEVPTEARLDGIAAMARYTPNRTGAIGYDTIPVTSRETVSAREANKFARYLSAVKYFDTMAGISATATEEFAAFASSLSSQGLTGPRCVECSLPLDAPVVGVRDQLAEGSDPLPLVLCVGSKEPRKNQDAVLVAAERLWREGLGFRLVLVGAYGWNTRVFRSWLRRLQRAGRSVEAPAHTDDAQMVSLYRQARFTVFPSLHEGFGLPVAESLAYGIPVVTTEYGSMGEIVEGGGCLPVDPRDDAQIAEAMRRLLVDDVEWSRLSAEATSRGRRTWEQFADSLWSTLVLEAIR